MNAVEITGLCKTYNSKPAVDELNMIIPQGAIYGFIGRNGAGKSTTQKMVCGLAKPTAGDIFLYGKPVSDASVREDLGVLIEEAGLYPNLTAQENMILQGLNKGITDVRFKMADALDLVGLSDTGKKKVKHFSMGMKQRLGIAMAILGDPKLLILDEPFVGLDPLGIILVKEKLIEMCKQKQTTVIFSSHQLSEVKEISELLVVIENGGIRYSGTYDELAQQNKQYRIILDKAINNTDFQKLTEQGVQIQATEQEQQYILMQGGSTLDILLRQLYKSDYTVREIVREDKILESLFV